MNTPLRWVDAHNHLQDPRLGDPEPLVHAMRQGGVSRCVVNATRESDWQAVENLAIRFPDLVSPAFGIHPWRAASAQPRWQDRLTALLARMPRASIGECGVDGWVDSPSREVQAPVFHEHLRLARELGRPVTIHCLKAWEPLFQAFKEEPPPGRFLMHSFAGSIEIARRLIPLGAFFSFSGHFLQPRKAAVIEVFRELPRDRILLETDAPDMTPPEAAVTHPLPDGRNHPANLAAIGIALAASLGMSAGDFATLTRNNAERLFSF